MTPPNTPVTMRVQEQGFVAPRQPAPQGSQYEAGIEKEQDLLAIEPIGKSRHHQSRDPRAESVSGDDESELRRADAEARHDRRAERRDQHEIKDDAEL
jgi:hypothetical protein